MLPTDTTYILIICILLLHIQMTSSHQCTAGGKPHEPAETAIRKLTYTVHTQVPMIGHDELPRQ